MENKLMKPTWKERKVAKLMADYNFEKVAAVMKFLSINDGGIVPSAEDLKSEVLMMFEDLDGKDSFVKEYLGLMALYVNDDVHKAIKLSFELETLQFVKTKEMQ